MRSRRPLCWCVGILWLIGGPTLFAGALPDSLVDELVLKHYRHGVLFEEAQVLGPTALPRLREILENPRLRSYWANATAVVGAIGTPASFDILQEFVLNRFEGTVDEDTFEALTSAIGVLGFACSSANPTALERLEKQSDPEYWSRITWAPAGRDSVRLRERLAGLALHSLAYCDTPAADAVFQRLLANPHLRERRNEILSVARTNEKVRTKGLKPYMQEQRRLFLLINPSARKRVSSAPDQSHEAWLPTASGAESLSE